MRATCVALLQGPSLRSRLCCPGPSSLNRPHPLHSQAHRNFTAQRFICSAFAVRERLGDPRAVPRFTCSILPSMSTSTSPGSRSLHTASSFATRTCLRRLRSGSALPTLGYVGAYWFTIVTTCWVARLPIGDFYVRASNELVTLLVAGYDYGGNWTIPPAGLPPAGSAASVAALGAESSRPASLLCTLRTRQSPNERQHSLLVRPLRL